MRWSYLVPRVVVLVIVWVFFAFLFDPLLRFGLVTAGQQVAAAKVNVDSLDTQLYPPEFHLGQVQVANSHVPGTNLVQFDEFHFQLEGDPLLYKRFVVREGVIKGLRFGTDRKDSGLLEDVPVDETTADEEEGFGELGEKASKMGKEFLDSLLDRAKVETDLKQFESIRLATKKEKQWRRKLASYQRRVKNLEKKIKEIERSAKNKKGNPLEKLERYRVASEDIKKVLKQMVKIRKEFPGLSRLAQNDFKELDAAQKRDQLMIKQKIDMFKMDGKELTDLLLRSEYPARERSRFYRG